MNGLLISIHSNPIRYASIMQERLSKTKAALLCAALMCGLAANAADEQAGPHNLLKELKTPFGGASGKQEDGPRALDTTAPIEIAPQHESPLRRSLSDRLVPVRLYLPGRLVIGKPAEFVIKGRAGYWAALAMAEKDSGAKPIYGHAIRLGADRKVVSVGKIPESGVLSLTIETPIQGDLIGQQLYFEAAVWSKDDMSDVQIAAPVTSEGPAAQTSGSGVSVNGVLVAAEADQKRGIRLVPETSVQMMGRQSPDSHTLDSGRP